MPSTKSPIPLAAKQLKERFVEATRQHTLGGATVLAELSQLARASAKQSFQPERTVAFTLSKLFGSLADFLNERPVKMSEADQTVAAFHQRALKAIEFLNGARDLGEPAALTADLIDLEFRLVP